MDYKITNFDVVSEQLCLEQTTELPIDSDFLVADYMGEIKRILKCRIVPFITTKQLSGNALMVEGTALISVIYYDNDGDIVTAEEEVPFKKTFEANRLIDDGVCKVSLSATTHTCRAITERKLSVKGSVKIDANITITEKKQIVSDIDGDCFEQLKGEISATTPLGKMEKFLVIDEEIILPQNMPSAHHIIKSSANATITDCKIISNKVIVKGHLATDILYCTAENEYKKHIANIPFNQIVDLFGIEENCECEATVQVCGFNLSARSSEDGGCRKFLVVSKLEIGVMARCNSSVPVIFDAYSTLHPVTPIIENIKFTYIAKQVCERFICKKILTLPDVGVNKILDIWYEFNGCTCRTDENGIILAGAINVCTLFCDKDNQPGCFEKNIDFEYPINLDRDFSSPYCQPEIKVLSGDYTFNGADPELKIELVICATVYDTKNMNLISKMEINDTAPITNKASLIAYYADKGENIWEICKNFLANRSEMIELNRLNEDTVSSPKMLLIPLM